MAKQNYTEIVCIIDRSGSMGAIRNEAIGGGSTVFWNHRRNYPARPLCP